MGCMVWEDLKIYFYCKWFILILWSHGSIKTELLTNIHPKVRSSERVWALRATAGEKQGLLS